MQLQQLAYFVMVADTRHFTRAAELIGVTQPSLSKQIHVLEEELGARLFDRVRGNIAMTQAGEALLPLARRILADADTARREVQQLIGLRGGRLRLGATPSLCTSLVADVLRRYKDAFPHIDLIIEENGSQDLAGDLARGELDLALIIPDHGTDPTLHTEPILRESLVVASSAARPAPARGRMHARDLRDHPLVMFRPGYDLRDTTLELCRREGFTPRFAIEGGEMDAVLSFVEAGIGIALVPSMVLAGRPGLRMTHLTSPGAHRTIALARRREVAPTHAASALRETLLAHIRESAAHDSWPAGIEPVLDSAPMSVHGPAGAYVVDGR